MFPAHFEIVDFVSITFVKHLLKIMTNENALRKILCTIRKQELDIEETNVHCPRKGNLS